jgi:hypothetical protein
MTRRLLRFALLCLWLLTVVAACAMGWAWWRDRGDGLEVSTGRTLFLVWSTGGHFHLWVVRDWTEPARASAHPSTRPGDRTDPNYDRVPVLETPRGRQRRLLGGLVLSGTLVVYHTPDGSVLRQGQLQAITGRIPFPASAPKAYFAIQAVPYWLAIGVLLSPSLLWLGVRARRARVRRQRGRRGLCLECGYDLRASGETCPECGAVAAGKASAGSAGGA